MQSLISIRNHHSYCHRASYSQSDCKLGFTHESVSCVGSRMLLTYSVTINCVNVWLPGEFQVSSKGPVCLNAVRTGYPDLLQLDLWSSRVKQNGQCLSISTETCDIIRWVHKPAEESYALFVMLFVCIRMLHMRPLMKQDQKCACRCWRKQWHSICLQSSANTSGVRSPVTKYWPSAKSLLRTSCIKD